MNNQNIIFMEKHGKLSLNCHEITISPVEEDYIVFIRHSRKIAQFVLLKSEFDMSKYDRDLSYNLSLRVFVPRIFFSIMKIKKL